MAAAWKGSISFGLVNIPVDLHSATVDTGPHFRLLHAKDRSPVSYARICQREGKSVDWKDIVKGYEYAKGKFVVLSKDDFEAAAVEKLKTVEIFDFVRDEEIDDRFFEHSYYAVPGKGGGRGYAVLREAMREAGRTGVGKMVMRESQHLMALTVVDNALVLTVMRFADELVDSGRFSFPSAKEVRPKELEMAQKLVGSLAGKWKPSEYRDEYRANLMRIIKAKMKGKEADLAAEEPRRSAEVIDLMERLRQSLAGRGTSRASGRTRGQPVKTGGKRAGKKAKSSRRRAAA